MSTPSTSPEIPLTQEQIGHLLRWGFVEVAGGPERPRVKVVTAGNVIPSLDHVHAHIERWPHMHHPEGLHGHMDPQELLAE